MTNRSTFPEQLDIFPELIDLPAEKLQDAQELKTLMATINKNSAQITRMNELLVELKDYYLSTELFNKTNDCLYNMEDFILNRITNYYKFCGSYDNSITYTIFNTVRFTDDNVYLLYNVNPSYIAGINPTNDTYWVRISGNYRVKGNYDSNKTYIVNDIVYYGIEKTFYSCIQNAETGVSPYNTDYWQPILNISNMLQQINDYTNDTTSLYVAHDMNIVINHNLNDYPLPLVIALNGSGYGRNGYGIGVYGGGNVYEVLAKAEYINTNNLKLYLGEYFDGTPVITQLNSTKYRIDFSNDNSLEVRLK